MKHISNSYLMVVILAAIVTSIVFPASLTAAEKGKDDKDRIALLKDYCRSISGYGLISYAKDPHYKECMKDTTNILDERVDDVHRMYTQSDRIARYAARQKDMLTGRNFNRITFEQASATQGFAASATINAHEAASSAITAEMSAAEAARHASETGKLLYEISIQNSTNTTYMAALKRSFSYCAEIWVVIILLLVYIAVSFGMFRANRNCGGGGGKTKIKAKKNVICYGSPCKATEKKTVTDEEEQDEILPTLNEEEAINKGVKAADGGAAAGGMK